MVVDGFMPEKGARRGEAGTAPTDRPATDHRGELDGEVQKPKRKRHDGVPMQNGRWLVVALKVGRGELLQSSGLGSFSLQKFRDGRTTSQLHLWSTLWGKKGGEPLCRAWGFSLPFVQNCLPAVVKITATLGQSMHHIPLGLVLNLSFPPEVPFSILQNYGYH